MVSRDEARELIDQAEFRVALGGYDRQAVDDLLAAVDEALGAGRPVRPLIPRSVPTVRRRLIRPARGYDRGQVDALLETLATTDPPSGSDG